MNYLGRPVFLFAINWSQALKRSVTYDLRSLMIGFGSELFQPSQIYTVNGWTFSVILRSGQELIDFEIFHDELSGRLNGFWLPCPLEAAKFVAGVSTTQFDVSDEGLSLTWSNRPDKHLLLIYPDGTRRAAMISAVAISGANERITLSAALPEIPPAGTVVKRLHYVRLKDDSLTLQMITSGVSSIEIGAVELPTEYADIQTGLKPIYLYQFSTSAPISTNWRFTSFAASVVSQNELFTASAISHGAIESGPRGDNPLEIQSVYGAPLSLFFPVPPQRPVNVTVWRVNYGALDTRKLLFSGRVREVNDDGDKLVAKCDSWGGILNRKVTRGFIQSNCNYDLFDYGCKVIRSQYETTATIVSINSAVFPPTVVLDLEYQALPQFSNWVTADWFAKGFLETGIGTSFEVRTILSSSLTTGPNRITLQLNLPLRNAQVGQPVQLLPGCDGSFATCRSKFFNSDNFGGFQAVPSRNLSLKALNTNVSQGNKK